MPGAAEACRGRALSVRCPPPCVMPTEQMPTFSRVCQLNGCGAPKHEEVSCREKLGDASLSYSCFPGHGRAYANLGDERQLPCQLFLQAALPRTMAESSHPYSSLKGDPGVIDTWP